MNTANRKGNDRTRATLRAALPAVLALTMGMAAPAARAQSQDWEIEVVTEISQYESAQSSAFAADGRPAIAYVTQYVGNLIERLYFACPDADGWSTEYVADGGYPALACDPATGEPTVAFCEFRNATGLHFARRITAPDGTSSWDVQSVDPEGWASLALAYSPGGLPCIAYSILRYVGGNPHKPGSYSYDVGFAQWDEASESWDKQVIDIRETYYDVFGIDLAFDSSGNPTIAYGSVITNDFADGTMVKVAHWNGASWDFEYPVSDYFRASDVSLAFDPMTGAATIAFAGQAYDGDARAKIAVRASADWSVPSGWNVENYHDAEYAGYYPALKFDSAGILHITHRGYPVRVTHRIDNDWKSEDLTPEAVSLSLAVNPLDDTLAVSFVQDILGLRWLMIARRMSTDYANFTPTVTITSPTDGAPFNTGAAIPFAATAEDAEEGDIAADLVWMSDLAGQIGTGPSFSAVLSDGTHVITATASDSTGKTGLDSITVVVGTQPSLYVAQIDMDIQLRYVPRGYGAEATVTVASQAGEPDGATVVGDWYYKGDLLASGDSAETDANGMAVILSPTEKSKSGDVFTFVVTDIIKDGYIYDSASNVVDEGSVAVP